MDPKAAWESELKRWLGIDPVADGDFLDWLWADLMRDFADVDLTDPAKLSDTIEDLVALSERACKAHLRSWRGAGAGGRPRESRPRHDLSGTIKFDPKTRAQVLALSEYLAKIFSVEKEVMAFRRRFLGGTTRTLKAEEARQVLRKWALTDDAQRSDDDAFLYWTGEEGHEMRFRGARGSAIGELDRLGEHFAKRYPWSEDQVVHLILCGGVLQVNSIQGRRRSRRHLGPPAHRFQRDTITLEIESWMPAELVKKAYTAMQRDSREGRKTRRGGDRNTEVFRFVVGRSSVKVVSEGEFLGKLDLPESYEKLREAWDARLPAGHPWRYGEKGKRNFHRDYMSGQKAVTGSEQSLPGKREEPMTRSDIKARGDALLKSLSASRARLHASKGEPS